MILFSNAKINIGLQVLDNRPDGYHNIETVFYPIPVFDILEIIENSSAPQGTCSFQQSGLQVPGDPGNNLCVQAYQLLNNDFHLPGVDLLLHKIIPFGAGIGGGSSNASHVLKALNTLFELNLSERQLIEYAVKLGADCPFFIRNKPSFATGLGEKLEDLDLVLQGYSMILITPNLHVSTREAFNLLEKKGKSFQLQENVQNLPVNQWKNQIINDFQAGLFEKEKQYEVILKEFAKTSPDFVSLSGTGSSIYAIYPYLSAKNSESIHSLKNFAKLNGFTFFSFDLE